MGTSVSPGSRERTIVRRGEATRGEGTRAAGGRTEEDEPRGAAGEGAVDEPSEREVDRGLPLRVHAELGRASRHRARRCDDDEKALSSAQLSSAARADRRFSPTP